MKKKLLLGLTLVLAASVFSACGSKQDDDGQAADGNGKVTYTMQTWDSSWKWDTPINKQLEEKTGVSFDYVPVLDSGATTGKVDVWLASGDYPDVINEAPLKIGKYKDAGALIPLEDLIDQYGPNIKKRFGKYYDLLKDEDGHIYSLYGVNLAKEPSPDSQPSFVVQYDVLKDAGYPEIKTLDQLFDVLQNYYKKHPKTADGKDVIPFSGLSGGLLDITPGLNAAGLPDHGFYAIDGNNNVSYALTSDANKEYIKFLNRLQRAGMLDKEIFSLNAETAGAKITQGRVLASYIPGWLMRGYEKSIIANGDFDKQYAKFSILANETVVDHSNALTPTSSSTNLAITNKAKHPERIIKLIDYLFTDEGQILVNWGIEGTHYDVVNGKRVKNAEFDKKVQSDPTAAAAAGIVGPFNRFSFGNGAKLDDGDYATPVTTDYIASTYDDTTKDVLSHYGKKTWADFMDKPEIYPTMMWQLNTPEDAKPIAIKLEDIWHKEIAKAILAASDSEFEAAWNGAVEQIDNNGKAKLEEMMTGVWKEFMERYNQAVK